MQSDQWAELNVGDVLQNNFTHDCYVVTDSTQYEDEQVYSLTRTVIARNPQEWERKRKTVDA